MNPETRSRTARYVLAAMLGLVGVNALGGGYYGMSGAEGVPTQWLHSSPFTSYLIPSLVLFFIVGGVMLGAAVAVVTRRSSGGILSLASGLVLLTWISAQVAWIGYVSWLQPLMGFVGVAILALTLRAFGTLSPFQLAREHH